MEYLGQLCQADVCGPGCLQKHQFFFVTVSATKQKGSKAGVDLKVDLHPRLQSKSFDALQSLSKAKIQVIHKVRGHLGEIANLLFDFNL